MPAKTPETMTLRDLAIFKAHTLEGKTLAEAAKAVGTSKDTVKRTKKKKAYRELVISALEANNWDVDEYAKKLIKLVNAERELSVAGEIIKVQDNVTQIAAIKKLGQIYGDDAPKEVDLTHSLASASDAELLEDLQATSEQYGVDERPAESEPDEGDAGEG
jgi:hypothetical protein